jgi:hypothetical protein
MSLEDVLDREEILYNFFREPKKPVLSALTSEAM